MQFLSFGMLIFPYYISMLASPRLSYLCMKYVSCPFTDLCLCAVLSALMVPILAHPCQTLLHVLSPQPTKSQMTLGS